ncbi:uncharacterized protein LOC123305032 isoform X2 [Chrysoperla carnea]|uniref:uncharacterized protein LOC123305032 isoform X2 n=1 Tax=Chrysoperla carnea TaxID=189513 RepID=UPI001D07147A|nr:uncharacterized protein LOC123305032 isoform X2 [Chrysoperla carnea]
MSPKKQRARKSPKKQKAKNQNKIEKFLVKSNVENKEVNSNNDEELQLKIKDLKIKIRELLKEKRELECLTFPKPYKLKDIPLNYDGAKFADTSYGTHTAKFRLKFHEFVGCVVSKVDEKRLVIKFHVFEVNKVHVYGIKLNSEDNQEAEGVDYTFSKCFVPPMIKIKELLKKYPVLDDPKPLIRVLATACQVFHDIQIQIDQFKEKSDPKYVTIFNSLNNRVIELSFQMVQRSTESVFPVSVELPYDIYKPRPIQIFINSKEMPRSTLKEFKKHCKNFYRFSIWNAFEIITNMGLKQHESVFYLLQGQSELAELNTDKPTILIKKKAKVVEQILHDFTFDTDDEDASVQKNNLDSSLNKSNVEIVSLKSGYFLLYFTLKKDGNERKTRKLTTKVKR